MDLFGEEPQPEIEAETVEDLAPVPQGPLSPRTMDVCLGHDKQLNDLLARRDRDRLPHALILAGPKGIGKATFAYHLTKQLFGEKQRAMVASGGHPDLLTVERQLDSTGREKPSVEIAEIRKVPPFLHMTASMGGWRIVIIDDADTMNRNAQNAILKNLEEPPNNTLLMLVTHRLGALIPTIRSRAHVIGFDAPNLDIFTQLLARQGHHLSPGETENLYTLSSQSVGRALQLLEEDGLEILNRLLDLFQYYPEWNWAQIHVLADELGRKGQESSYQTFQRMTMALAHELMISKARNRPTSQNLFQTEALKRILQNSSLEKLSKICENLDEHFARVQGASLDKRQGVMEAFSIMRAAA